MSLKTTPVDAEAAKHSREETSESEMSESQPLKTNGQTVDKRTNLQSGSRCKKLKTMIKRNLLLILSVAAIIFGFIIGFSLRNFRLTSDSITWIGLPGELFLNLLKMMIIPVIASSIISGISSLDAKSSSKATLIMFIFIVANNTMGSLTGLLLAVTIKPGDRVAGDIAMGYIGSNKVDKSTHLKTQDIVADLARNMIPPNIIQATLQKAQTMYETEDVTNSTTPLKVMKKVIWVNDFNILGILVACMLFGIAANRSGKAASPFVAFFRSLFEVTLVLLNWVMWLAPFGIASLLIASLASIEDLQHTFASLGLFIAAVVVGVTFQQVILYPILVYFSSKINPINWVILTARIWIMAFSSTASIAAIPEMYKMCHRLRMPNHMIGLIIPLGVTFTAAGSALFITISSFFIAQIEGVNITSAQIFVMFLLTVVSSLALPSVPSSSIVTIVVILTSLGIPGKCIGLLFAIEWLLDRLRTTSNSVGLMVAVMLTLRFMGIRRFTLAEINDVFNEDEIYVEKNANEPKDINTDL